MWLATDDALDAHILHQPCYCATSDVEPFTDELPPDLADAVDLVVLLPDTFDLGPQGGITTGAVRQA